MISRRGRARMRRRVEQAAAGDLAPRYREEVTVHLRADDTARAGYDRVIDAYRVLAGEPVARVELDLVERWLFDDAPQATTRDASRTHAIWTRFFGVFAAVAAAVLLVVGPLHPDPGDGLRPKGGASAVLSIDALCGATGPSGLRPADRGGGV